jgi:hypothetical protein
MRWSARQAGVRRMAIPSGAVDDELKRVVLAIVAARDGKELAG